MVYRKSNNFILSNRNKNSNINKNINNINQRINKNISSIRKGRPNEKCFNINNNNNNSNIVPICPTVVRHPQHSSLNPSTYVQRQNNYEFKQNINHIKQSCNNSCTVELECLESEQIKTKKMIKNMNVEIDDINNSICKLESKINKISCVDLESKCEKIGGSIKKLGLECMEFVFNKYNDNCITIEGVYKASKLKIKDTEGIIKFYTDQIPLNSLSFQDVLGNINILNIDNQTIYSGFVTYDNSFQYILSNRPIVPIGVPFNAIIKIKIKIYLCL